MKSKKIEIITAEYEIAVVQLERLKHIARERLFSPEEAKLYDILVRNLKLSTKDDDTKENALLKEIEEQDDATLLKIAGGEPDTTITTKGKDALNVNDAYKKDQ